MRNTIQLLLTLLLLSHTTLAAQPGKSEDDTTAVKLKEIVVKGDRQLVENKGSESKINIAGSPFENIGSVWNMLGNLPGLTQSGTGIEVIGAGTPIFYLDGREIRDVTELQYILSSDIKEVRIDRTPGLSYSSTGQPVIFITTRKRLSDYINLQIGNTIGIRRKVSDYPSMTLKGKFGKLTSSLTYSYGTAGNLIKESYFREIYNDAPSDRLFTRRNPTREFSHNVTWSNTLGLNRSSYMGLYYYFTHEDRRDWKTGENIFSQDGITSVRDLTQTEKGIRPVHSVTALYAYSKGSRSFAVTQDLAFSNDHATKGVNERMPDGAITDAVNTDAVSRYTVLTTNARFGTVIPGKIGMSAGLRYDHTDNRAEMDRVRYGTTKGYQSVTRTREDNPQLYVAFARSFGKLSATVGVRYDYIHRYILYRSGDTELPVTHARSEILPWVNLRIAPVKNLDLSLRYRRYTTNPNFNRVNSGTVYVDSLTYNVSNPDLSSSVTDLVSFYATYKGIRLGMSYRYTSHPIVNVLIPRDSHTAIVEAMDINLPKSMETEIDISYSKSIAGFNAFGNVSLGLPYARIRYLDHEILRNRFHLGLNVNCSYRINSHLSVYANYNLQGRRVWLITEQRSVQKLNAGMTLNLLKNRLTASLEFQDIFHKAHYNNVWDTYGDVRWGTFGTNDMSGIRFNLSYTIFDKKINISPLRYNEDTLNRTL